MAVGMLPPFPTVARPAHVSGQCLSSMLAGTTERGVYGCLWEGREIGRHVYGSDVMLRWWMRNCILCSSVGQLVVMLTGY